MCHHYISEKGRGKGAGLATSLCKMALVPNDINMLFISLSLSLSQIYLERLIHYSDVDLHPCNWKRILLAAILLASKVWDDQAGNDIHWCGRDCINDIHCPLHCSMECGLLSDTTGDHSREHVSLGYRGYVVLTHPLFV